MVSLAHGGLRSHPNSEGRRSQTEILICALYVRARSGLGFKRSQDRAGGGQEERGEVELLDPAF